MSKNHASTSVWSSTGDHSSILLAIVHGLIRKCRDKSESEISLKAKQVAHPVHSAYFEFLIYTSSELFDDDITALARLLSSNNLVSNFSLIDLLTLKLVVFNKERRKMLSMKQKGPREWNLESESHPLPKATNGGTIFSIYLIGDPIEEFRDLSSALQPTLVYHPYLKFSYSITLLNERPRKIQLAGGNEKSAHDLLVARYCPKFDYLHHSQSSLSHVLVNCNMKPLLAPFIDIKLALNGINIVPPQELLEKMIQTRLEVQYSAPIVLENYFCSSRFYFQTANESLASINNILICVEAFTDQKNIFLSEFPLDIDALTALITHSVRPLKTLYEQTKEEQRVQRDDTAIKFL